jgi:hypothetical protein
MRWLWGGHGPSLNFDKFAELVFASDPNVVSVCVVDDQYKVLGLVIRKGARIYTTEENIRNYISLAASIVVDSFAKREHDLGILRLVTARYDKFVLSFAPVKEKLVVLGFDPNVVTPLAAKALEVIREASSFLE